MVVQVQLDGKVSFTQDPQLFTVLKIEELNDQGEMADAPVEIVTRIIASPAATLQPVPTTLETMPPTPKPTKAGASLIPVFVALVADLAFPGRMKN